jgi:macrolide-specific efflux system membrane fusion protein
MKLTRPVIVNGSLALVIVLAGAAAFLVFNPFTAKTVAATTQLTGTVQQGAVTSSITANGSIAALREVSASFATSGTIASVKVALGDTVKKGEVLGTLKKDDLETAVTDAETSLSRAYSTLSDAEDSLTQAKKNAKSDPQGSQSVTSAKSQVNSAEDAVDSAEKNVTTAKEDLADATLKAPISGLVIAVDGEVGGTASAGGSAGSGSGSDAGTGTGTGTGFMTIADVSKFTVTAAIAEADIADVKVGQAAKITFPALENASSTATVTAIAPTATASNSVVTYATTITLTDPPDGLRLGQTADVTITTKSSAADALYVPAAAITTANGASTVKVVGSDGTTTSVTVKLGVVGDAGTEIASGLKAGQTIVIGAISPTTDQGTTGGGTRTGRGGFGGSAGFTGGANGGFGGVFTGGTDGTVKGGNR